MTEAGRNRRMELMTEEIQSKYGILVSYKQVGELLALRSPTAINKWIIGHDIVPAGRRGYYYSRDVARAIVDTGVVAT